jgi:hypothetical protein
MVSVDWVRQFLFVPKSAGKNLTVDGFDHFFNRFTNARRILCVAIGVEDKHAFVNVLCHVPISFYSADYRRG